MNFERNTKSFLSDNIHAKIFIIAMGLTIFYLTTNLLATHVGGVRYLIGGDVEHYLNMYKNLRENTFSKNTYTYGIGFPLMGFISWNQNNPFLLFSMLMFLISFYHLFSISNFLFSFNSAIIVSLINLATAPFLIYYITSQNVIITITLIIIIFSMIIRKKPLTAFSSLTLGFLFGLDFASRYIDPFLIAPGILYLAVFSYKEHPKHMIRNFLLFIASSTPWFILTLYLHQKYFGAYLQTPYALHIPYVARITQNSEDIFTHLEFHFFNHIIRNFYQVLIDPNAYALPSDIADKKSLFMKMPYLVFIFSGIYYWVKQKQPKISGLLSLAVIFLFTSLFYVSFWAFTAHDLKFGCLRYLSGWYPILGILSLFGIKRILEIFSHAIGFGAKVRYMLVIILIHTTAITIFLLIPVIDHWYIDKLSYSKKNWEIITNKYSQDIDKIIDENYETRWSTGAPMKKGDFVCIDAGQNIKLSQIRFDLRDKAENDFPPKLIALHSQNGEQFKEIENIRCERQNHIWILNFPKIITRWIRIEVVQRSASYWWSIYELNLLK